jgi:hypothetical protein
MDLSPGQIKVWQVDCPGGKKALGGGVSSTPLLSATRIFQSAPAGAGDGMGGWRPQRHHIDDRLLRLGDLRERLLLRGRNLGADSSRR